MYSYSDKCFRHVVSDLTLSGRSPGLRRPAKFSLRSIAVPAGSGRLQIGNGLGPRAGGNPVQKHKMLLNDFLLQPSRAGAVRRKKEGTALTPGGRYRSAREPGVCSASTGENRPRTEQSPLNKSSQTLTKAPTGPRAGQRGNYPKQPPRRFRNEKESLYPRREYACSLPEKGKGNPAAETAEAAKRKRTACPA